MTPREIADLLATKIPADWRMVEAVAIVLGESGGHELARSPVKSSERDDGTHWWQDCGLFQINTMWHGDLVDWSALTFSAMFDSAQAWEYVATLIGANDVAAGEGSYDWSAWNAYTNGSFRRHMRRALDGVNEHRADAGLESL